MITPTFRITQDDNFIFVEIHAPNSRLEKTEFEVLDNLIIFSSPPYYLRINLPGNIVSDDEESCEWNAEKGDFSLKVSKETKGEEFQGLDMIARLLAVPKSNKSHKKIEVVNEESFDDNNENLEDEDFDLEDENDDFYLQQSISQVLTAKYSYGFNNSYNDIIEIHLNELFDNIVCKNPGQTSYSERREQRIMKENLDFDEEHYLSNLYDDKETINRLLNFKQLWICKADSQDTDLFSKFTTDEIFTLKNMASADFCLNKKEKRNLLYGLVDILFAYAYDLRINEGDSCSESAWNIHHISSTLSWFESFSSLSHVLIACARRCLCYPLYRHYALFHKSMQDVIDLLKTGPIAVLKCLLEIRTAFLKYCECENLFNNLYINDYCVWLQLLDRKYFTDLANLIQKKLETFDKDNIDLDIKLLEKAAELTIEEDALERMAAVSLKE